MSFSLFKSRAISPRMQIERQIISDKRLLDKIDSDKREDFLNSLAIRIKDFTDILDNPKISATEKAPILSQYQRFTHTLHVCLTSPLSANSSISKYHNQNYYPVGVTEVFKTDPMFLNTTIGAAITGALLCIVSIPAFFMHPMIGAILITAGITLLAPSLLLLCLPDSLDPTRVKKEEELLFQDAATLAKEAKSIAANEAQPTSPVIVM